MVWAILRRPSRRVPPLVVADVALDVETGWLSVGGWTVRLHRPGGAAAGAIDATARARGRRRRAREHRCSSTPRTLPALRGGCGVASWSTRSAHRRSSGIRGGISVPARRPDRLRTRSAPGGEQCRGRAGGPRRRLAEWTRRPGEWHRGWTALQQFVAVRGTAAVPSRAMAGGVALGSWADARDRSTGRAGWIPPTSMPWSPFPAGDGRAEASGAGRLDSRHCTATYRPRPSNPTVQRDIRQASIGEWVTEQRRAHAAGTLPTAACRETRITARMALARR